MYRQRNYLKYPVTAEERRARAAYYGSYSQRLASVAQTTSDSVKTKKAER